VRDKALLCIVLGYKYTCGFLNRLAEAHKLLWEQFLASRARLGCDS